MDRMKNSKSQMRKGVLEFCVLMIISKQAIYALDIIKSLRDANIDVNQGTLYPLLNRLIEQKLVVCEWSSSKQGPPRKYYSLSPAGRQNLQYLISNWLEMVDIITNLMEK